MSGIALAEVTLPLLDAYYRGFETDPDLYMDLRLFRPYAYAPEKVAAYYERLRATPDRVGFMIMLGDRPIGEVALKHIDRGAGTCELSIHLQSDAVKNRGYGTRAERLMLQYTFDILKMNVVYADAVLKNSRSQHVLEKLGFERTGQDGTFVHYRLNIDEWKEKF